MPGPRMKWATVSHQSPVSASARANGSRGEQEAADRHGSCAERAAGHIGRRVCAAGRYERLSVRRNHAVRVARAARDRSASG
jgi:hypothetical protein